MTRISTEELVHLPPDERLDLIAELWDSLSPEDVPVTSEQREELDRRLALYRENPTAGDSWDSIRDTLRKK